MNIDRLGWVAAAALAGGMVGMGFKAPGDKTGSVDVSKVFSDSDYAHTQRDLLQSEVAARKDIVQFVTANRDMKLEDAQKLRKLSTATTPTAADKTEIERIKTDAAADEKKARDLQTRDKPTPAELTQIEEYTRRKDAIQNELSKWNQEFNTELQTAQATMQDDAIKRVRGCIQQVARDQGYSLVFSTEVAPYSANDLTADALKAMNNKK